MKEDGFELEIKILEDLARLTGRMAAAGDLLGVRFFIESCDAILGHALVIIEGQQARAAGKEC